MFTGIVQDIGEITAIDRQGDWMLTVATAKLPLDRMAVGASVSCDGICLTVIEKSRGHFKVQVSAETLSCTTALHWKPGSRVNLEPALRAGDELGGHLVTGHIDGLARVVSKKKEGESVRFVFELPQAFAKFVAAKGSIALGGVSLTVGGVDGPRFDAVVIPHTQGATVMGALEPGDEVNFEVDLMARYAERLLNQRSAA